MFFCFFFINYNYIFLMFFLFLFQNFCHFFCLKSFLPFEFVEFYLFFCFSLRVDIFKLDVINIVLFRERRGRMGIHFFECWMYWEKGFGKLEVDCVEVCFLVHFFQMLFYCNSRAQERKIV